MAIASADIRTFVNNQLKRSETQANIDLQLQLCLDDLSDENLLAAQDTSQSLSSSDTYLDYPAGYKQMKSIVLNDGDTDGPPLKPMSWEEYRLNMEDEGTSDYSEPEWYAEDKANERLYVYHPSDGAYDAIIDYYRYHPQDVDTILFGDEFNLTIKAGTAYFVALRYGLANYIAMWGTIYEKKKFDRICCATEPQITRSR